MSEAVRHRGSGRWRLGLEPEASLRQRCLRCQKFGTFVQRSVAEKPGPRRFDASVCNGEDCLAVPRESCLVESEQPPVVVQSKSAGNRVATRLPFYNLCAA
jgi:hypothetical protein